MVQNWSNFLQGGISTALDGYIQIETAKAGTPAEQIPPVTTEAETSQVAVEAALSQNNLQIAGIELNSGALMIAGALIAAVFVFKSMR